MVHAFLHLSFFLNSFSDAVCVVSIGSRFHSVAARYGKDRCVIDRRTFGRWSRLVHARRVTRVVMSDLWWNILFRALGASQLFKARNTFKQSRSLMSSSIVGHWSALRVGVMCSWRRVPVTTRAAKFITFWTRDIWFLQAPPQTGKQYNIWEKTCAWIIKIYKSLSRKVTPKPV